MFEIVSAFINFFLNPYLWLLLPFFAMGLLLILKQTKHFNRLFYGSLAWLFIITSPLAGLLTDWHEHKIPRPELAQLGPFDAIVALGGGNLYQHKESGLYKTNRTATRYLEAMILARRLQVPNLLLSRSMILDNRYYDEAQSFENLLKDLGATEQGPVLSLFKDSTNTYTESLAAVEKLKEISATKILLVTSSLHMPRALKVYQRYSSLQITPYPVDYSFHEQREISHFGLVNLNRWRYLLHEWLGHFAYKLTGKIL